MKYLKVENHDNLIRDKSNMAIINNNSHEYTQYIEQKKILANKNSEINTLKKEVFQVKEELQELKSILYKILKDKNEY